MHETVSVLVARTVANITTNAMTQIAGTQGHISPSVTKLEDVISWQATTET